MRLNSVLVLGSITWLAGCGTTVVGTGAGSPSPLQASSSPHTPATIRIVATDAGTVFDAHVGDTIELTLTNSYSVPGSSTTWDAASADNAVLTRTASHVTTPAGPAAHQVPYVADFSVVGRGPATITATAHATCEAMDPQYCKGPAPLIFTIRAAG